MLFIGILVISEHKWPLVVKPSGSQDLNPGFLCPTNPWMIYGHLCRELL